MLFFVGGFFVFFVFWFFLFLFGFLLLSALCKRSLFSLSYMHEDITARTGVYVCACGARARVRVCVCEQLRGQVCGQYD